MVDNPGHILTDFEEKLMKKKTNRIAKKQACLENLHAPIRTSTIGFVSLSLSCLIRSFTATTGS